VRDILIQLEANGVIDPSTELVDVTDEFGTVIAVVTRKEMRERRLPHRCVYVLVFDSCGRLFVHLRTRTKDVYPAHWDVCIGGVLSAGESFDAAARREGREELGVDLEPRLLFPFQYADRRTVAHGTVYHAVHDGPFVLQPEELEYGEFVPTDELAGRFTRQPYCPDGVLVWQKYCERSRGPNVLQEEE
jgi:isopentenyldiphosphate isomerase